MPPRAVIKENLSEQIYRSLRLSLMDGEYRPGERLTISAVAEHYGTSITPVREAIFRLASERALEVKAATSVIVPNLTTRDLREIVAIRKDLEGMAAYRTGQIATARMIEELEAQNALFSKAAAQSPREAAQANRDFHFMILRFSEMPYVEAICENMWTLMGPFLRTFHEEIPIRRLTADNHQHFRFLSAVHAGDPVGAREAMQADIAWSEELILRREELAEREAKKPR
ncbi:GntR family transcriptional regulator [Paenirhodobacter populi]|uniref:GntR family transcriptional regulator n=1 Tax=Paenirhodobacter populi TaxID=2306993 RepID=A0A443K6Q7_9RHOB|nr:GntR family transcriptional regulator [Sinirhodobacter populi]RWR05712.1 GntR family transcriptional regulator [Sinirhodobacter populi]RWR15320.1 GntR family transcriptional regulator [Sinirhodobacter populi]RWR21498.1 GntR family transcriptional regulator [Sinirhodobacter populi]RWR28458.1 GntR family transcriptional regulator [Sinirhodobacter populi]